MEFDFSQPVESDWEIVDEEKSNSIIEKIKQIKNSKLSAYGKKKAIRKVKKESGDDLTITY